MGLGLYVTTSESTLGAIAMRTLPSLVRFVLLAVLAAGCTPQGVRDFFDNGGPEIIGHLISGVAYTDPTADFTAIQSVAVFPMHNTSFAPAESRELNRRITQVIEQKNPTIEILGPVEVNDRLNDHGLADDYNVFLAHSASGRTPDREMLGQLRAALGTDAILQAEIVQVIQEDSQFGGDKSFTRVRVRYSVLDCHKGKVLWEASGDGQRSTTTMPEGASPIVEAVELAVYKILDIMPRFGPVPR